VSQGGQGARQAQAVVYYKLAEALLSVVLRLYPKQPLALHPTLGFESIGLEATISKMANLPPNLGQATTIFLIPSYLIFSDLHKVLWG
jgi:hypothetical protein